MNSIIVNHEKRWNNTDNIKKAVLADLSEVKKNLLLLLSMVSNQPIKGKLWYQKQLFLISKNNPILEGEANFEPYFWGPHSELADAEMEELVQLKVVNQEGNNFVLTQLGMEIADTILKDTNKSEKELIEEIKSFVNNLTKEELLLFIYTTYPEMSEDAVEFKALIPRRKEIAISIYKKGLISIGKAAEIAEISIDNLIKELQGKHIYVIESNETF